MLKVDSCIQHAPYEKEGCLVTGLKSSSACCCLHLIKRPDLCTPASDRRWRVELASCRIKQRNFKTRFWVRDLWSLKSWIVSFSKIELLSVVEEEEEPLPFCLLMFMHAHRYCGGAPAPCASGRSTILSPLAAESTGALEASDGVLPTIDRTRPHGTHAISCSFICVCFFSYLENQSHLRPFAFGGQMCQTVHPSLVR
jgi:hypothetical protein